MEANFHIHTVILVKFRSNVKLQQKIISTLSTLSKTQLLQDINYCS